MTCIVALKHNGKTYIGGDSCGPSGWDLTVRTDPKVFQLGDMLIGFTSSFRMGQILRYHVTVPDHPADMDDMTFMVRVFVEHVRTVFKDYGFTTIESNSETGGVFIVGYRGEIYTVESDYQVGVSALPYAACGCGEAYALGSLATQSDKVKPKKRVLKALETSEQFSIGVCAPFVVLEG